MAWKKSTSDELAFDRLAYFGDSLTDSDEFFNASSAVAFVGLPLTALGYAQQFSNGDVYSDHVPGLIGVEGGEALNYAVAGAQALTDRTIAELLPPSLIRPDATAEDLAFRVDIDGQVARFLEDEAGNDLSSTAASLFIGFNDFNDFVPTSPETAFAEVLAFGAAIATETAEAATALAGAGVGTIILNTLGDPSIFPSTQFDPPELQALATGASLAVNAGLAATAKALEAQGVNVITIDLGAMFAEIEADFASFNFRTLDDPVLIPDQNGDGVEEFNPAVFGVPLDQIAFFDAVHPTAALHGILAGFQSESLTSDVQIGDAAAEHLRGTRDDDLVLGAEGDDHIWLRRGDDVGLGGLGDDRISGGRGDDLVAGGAGDDRLGGGRGQDILTDGTGDDRTGGGRGDDLIIDSAGNDRHFGGRGNDTMVFTEAALMGRDADDRDVFNGGWGYDTLILRVEDASSVEIAEHGNRMVIDSLGVVARNIENIVVVEGTDLTGEAFYDDQMATADLWNFL